MNTYNAEQDYLRTLLLSCDNVLLITPNGYNNEMLSLFPVANTAGANPSAFITTPPTYQEISAKVLAEIQEVIAKSELDNIVISDDYENDELPDGSLAYHRIFGTILSDARWWFSTKAFEQNVLKAEANPRIACHFMHISSGGGEAWYLDRASETLRNCTKPIYVLCEKVMGSAAYYLGCHGTKIKALTQNDIIGCIGSMTSFYDFDGYYKQLGINKIEVVSTKSPLKNKKYLDLKNGKPDQYITEELDPLAEQFLEEIRTSRPILKNTSDDAPEFQGETFSASLAIENKLIDGISTLTEAVLEAHSMGQSHLTKRNAYQLLK